MVENSVKRQEALSKITEGVAKFQSEIYPAQRSRFESLRKGQQPLALFIACADSRVVPSLITQTEPGEVFVERNPGNLVPRYSEFVGGVSASIEYAMLVLKVPLVILCGHTDCGVMKAVADPQQAEGMPGLQRWMQHALLARERLLCDHPDVPAGDKIRLLAEYNVLAQMENLKTHPAIVSRLESNEVEIHGWLYDIADGSVREANPKTRQFELLGGAERL
jgi:carbonic anhydrase